MNASYTKIWGKYLCYCSLFKKVKNFLRADHHCILLKQIITVYSILLKEKSHAWVRSGFFFGTDVICTLALLTSVSWSDDFYMKYSSWIPEISINVKKSFRWPSSHASYIPRIFRECWRICLTACVWLISRLWRWPETNKIDLARPHHRFFLSPWFSEELWKMKQWKYAWNDNGIKPKMNITNHWHMFIYGLTQGWQE